MAHRSRKNKENLVTTTTMKSFTNTITNTFKVKKCLFNSPKSEPDSPNAESPLSAGSPDVKPMDEDSPYALFQMRKRRSVCTPTTLKILDSNDVTPLKRAIIHGTSQEKEEENMVISSPENSNSIKQAVQKSMADANLTGDFSKELCLPTIKGSHPDLKSISPATAAGLLQGPHFYEYLIVDCRYPYEYEGGHIRNAINMYYKDDVELKFFNAEVTAERKESNKILIMYCEFSSQRAPSMLRFLRGLDRDKNKDYYPFLFYPEMYLIEGGYKAFHTHFKELCEPEEYRTMLDKDCSEELAFYRSKCKTWNVKSKRCKRTRPALMFESPNPTSKE